MADVVGTAYVRIKALTTNLAKDIESNVKKAAKDADVEGAGELVGEDLVKAAGRKIKSGMEDAVNDSTKNIDKKVDVDGGRRLGDRLVEGIRSGLETIGDSKIFKGLQDKVAKLMGLDEKSGQRKGRSFGRGILGAIVKFGALFSPAILGAGSLLVQYVTALVGQIGLLVTAALGAGTALGVLFGAVGLSIIPIALALTTKTKELEKFKKVAEGIGKAWKEVGAATQETLLPGLTRALELSKEAIPVFRGFGRAVGTIAGRFAELAVGEVVGDMDRLRNILQGSARILDSLSEVAFNFVSIFLDFFEAALPIGEQFADALERMSDRWQNLLGEAADSGRLTDVLQTWYDRAVLVGGALGDIVAAIFNVFDVGAESAVPFFENFATWAQEFRDFTNTEAGQNKLKQIFDDAMEVAHEFNGLVVDIFNVIGGQVFAEGGNEGIVGFIQVLREDFIPLIDGFATKLKEDYGPALSEFFDAFGEFIVELAKADGLNIILETLTTTLEAFTIALQTLMEIPGFSTFLGLLIGIGGSLKILGAAFGLLKKTGIVFLIQRGIIPAFTALASAVYAVAFAFGISFAAAAAIVVGIIAAVVGAVALLIIHWDKVKEAFNATVRFFKDPMSRLEALRENIENLIGTIGDGLGRALGAAGRALSRFGGVVRERVEDAVGAALEALSRLPGIVLRALGGLATTVLRALGGLGSTLIRAFGRALTAVARALPGLALDILVFFATLPLRILAGLARLLEIFLDVFVRAHLAVANFLAFTVMPALLDFFGSIPGHIATALGFLGQILGDAFGAAWDFARSVVNTAVQALIDFIVALPGRLAGGLTSLPGVLANIFQTAVDGVTTIVSTAINGIIEFFTNLPGQILGLVETIRTAAADIGGAIIGGILDGLAAVIDTGVDVATAIVDAITDAFRTAWNAIIDEANELWNQIEFDAPGPIPGTLGLPDDILKNLKFGAMGGIFNVPTQMIIGEAGPEVLIPLNNPSRALELFNRSGLGSVLTRAQGNGAAMMSSLNSTRPSGVTPTATLGRRGGDIVIQQMNIEAPTPLESARQTAERLRIMQAQLVTR